MRRSEAADGFSDNKSSKCTRCRLKGMPILIAVVAVAVVLLAPDARALDGGATTAWSRIRAQLKTPRQTHPPALRAAVAEQIVWFQRHRPRLATDLRVMTLYLPHVIDATARRGLPGEVILIPLVESGFAGKALSHRGARGIWQLMPGTARDRGLRVSDDFDERLHPVDATRAALDLIEHYYNIDRNWLRVYAAYNAGLKRVRRAVREASDGDRRFHAWSLNLPAESRVYVARLLAAAAIIDNPARYDFVLPPVPADNQLLRLHADGRGRFRLADFAAGAGWSGDDAARANPHLADIVTRGERQSSILVPRQLADAAARWLAAGGGFTAAVLSFD